MCKLGEVVGWEDGVGVGLAAIIRDRFTGDVVVATSSNKTGGLDDNRGRTARTLEADLVVETAQALNDAGHDGANGCGGDGLGEALVKFNQFRKISVSVVGVVVG